MTYLSQTLLMSDIVSDYSATDESLTFQMVASFFPREGSKFFPEQKFSNFLKSFNFSVFNYSSLFTSGGDFECPAGYDLDNAGSWCNDVDECVTMKPCSHTCTNLVGAFLCSCPKVRKVLSHILSW